MAIFLIILTIGAAGGLFYYVSTVEHDAAVWHVDPLTVEQSVKPNSFRMAPPLLTEEEVDAESPVYTVNPTLMAKAFDDYVVNQPKTGRIAGSPEEGWMTYVQLSPSLNLPDYVSVKFIDLNGGNSTIAVYSRSRFGYDDRGVNEKRVLNWVSTLQSFEQ